MLCNTKMLAACSLGLLVLASFETFSSQPKHCLSFVLQPLSVKGQRRSPPTSTVQREKIRTGSGMATTAATTGQFLFASAPADEQQGVKDNVAPNAQTLSEVLAAAVHAASEAGALMKAKIGADVLKTKFNPKDLLTEVDAECQRAIEKVVSRQFPNHALLGEENVAPGAEASTVALRQALGDGENGSQSDWLWIVDPIDGTTNFVHGMPLSAVSIGVSYRGQVVVGCIYDPFRDELFTATRGNGAFLNGLQMTVGDQATIEEATVACGSPPGVLALGPCVRGMAALAPYVRTTRMLGSAAIMLAWVACGRLTSYWEPDLNSWDVAAGSLLIQEAGGVMTDIDGSPYTLSTRAIIGSNALVHEEIRKRLVEAGAARPDSTPQL